MLMPVGMENINQEKYPQPSKKDNREKKPNRAKRKEELRKELKNY